MEIKMPEASLVVMCGVAGCGKSTFALKNFRQTAVVSSDRCREIVSDDEGNMEASRGAFELFYFIIEKRMGMGRLVIADSTALSYDARKKLLGLAYSYNYHVVLIAFDVLLDTALKRNSMRDRKVSEKVIQKQYRAFTRALKYIDKEGFDQMAILRESEMEGITFDIVSSKMEIEDSGPFDIISDIHGCCSELELLLHKLGYNKDEDTYRHPEGRKVIFSGDIVDRGPRVIDTIKTVINMVSSGNAYYIPGNHCNKFYRFLNSRRVQVKNGLETSAAEFSKLDKRGADRLKKDFIELYEKAPAYLILDKGKLIVAHAGIKENMIGKISKEINDFVLYGDVHGELDQEGFPLRGDWAADYCGKVLIVYGHTPVLEPVFVNNTINIDQGVSIGGSLSALRYPEKKIISVKALSTYYSSGRTAGKIDRDITPDDYRGTITVRIKDGSRIKIEALEVAEAIKMLNSITEKLPWIVYLPCFPHSLNNRDIVEQGEEAFKIYRNKGAQRLIIQETNIDNSLILLICKDSTISKGYFLDDRAGEIYSVYNKLSLDEGFKEKVIQGLVNDLNSAGYFDENNTDFVIFEAYMQENNKQAIVPTKLVSHSCLTFFNKDNLWQLENTDKLCDSSGILKKNRNIIFEDRGDISSSIKEAVDDGYEEFAVKPVSTLDKMVQPEILCTKNPIYLGEEGLSLSTLAFELSTTGLEKFIKGKLSKKYFEFIIGSAAFNNKLMKLKKK